MVGAQQFPGILDLPDSLIRDIIYYAEIPFHVLKKLALEDSRCLDLVRASSLIITNDFSLPHETMLSVDGFGPLGLDIYGLDVRQSSFSRSSFIYLILSHECDFDKLNNVLKAFEGTFQFKVLWFVELYKKKFFYNGGVNYYKYTEWLTGEISTKIYYDPTKLPISCNILVFNNMKSMIGESIKRITYTPDDIESITIYHTDKSNQLTVSNLKLKNLKQISIFCPSNMNLDTFHKLYDCYISPNQIIVPIVETNRVTFNNCSLPQLETLKTGRITKIEAIIDCSFPKLEHLMMNNNFMFLIRNSNFQNLKCLSIRKVFKISDEKYDYENSNLSILDELLADCEEENSALEKGEVKIDLEKYCESYCKRYNIDMDKIELIPFMLLENVNFKSLKHLKVPHENYLMTAAFDDSTLNKLCVEIE
ncbi:hypothetical protein BN7_3862 [Wickerhamomyces ciferrii]|uniref:Uncharacterized protein n=1 Tax=Wickerhamomyces ciferrii (strain ATCC 14091 / BCRC 22168 / CBS 111 / JCM 3599 / NBRC 0793 / NRRL Y-1031 F-60-10) TaxID=1206466 RepID=K0KGM5_WICCF|nr:uncharacterized protein BN7_3862 [Wickerhamomyces ciferrii]CCH44300.1 hypothetical protein BN7_3862 [Wickerhamomyces ciferrii]